MYLPAKLSKILYTTKVINKENLNQGKPCIYIANHTSLLDAIVLYGQLPDDVVYITKPEIKKKYSAIMKGKNIVVIEPSNPYSLRILLKMLKEGKSLVIFPEGRITVTNTLMKMYTGVAFLALKTGYPIVPIGFDGGEKAKKFTYLEDKIPTKWFPQITMYVGEAFTIPSPEGLTMREKKEQGTHLIYRTLQSVVFNSRMPDNINLVEMFHQRVKEAPDMVIAEEMKVSITMKKLWKKILYLSEIFENKILQEKVGVLLPTSIGAISTIYGLLRSGKTPAMLNFSMDASTLNSCLDIGGIGVVITSRAFVTQGKLEKLIESCKSKVDIIYLEDLIKEINAIKVVSASLKSNKKITHNNDILLFTSGSEGVPKGVILTQKSIYANVQQIRIMLDFTSQDKIVNVLPIFHSFGLILTFLCTLSHIPTVLIPSPLLYRAIPEIIYAKKGTILLGTSTFLSAYGRYANAYDFFNLRYVICGAEKCQDSVRELWMKKAGIRILEGYGLTETSPVLSLQTPLLYKEGTVGCLLPGIEHKIEEVEGIEDGGKLIIKAPNLMKGYLLRDKGFVEAPEWFDTGDIVSVDEEGFISIKGRSKLFVKIGGEMVSLPTVEEHAKKALGVNDLIAIGLSDNRKGEKIVVVTTSMDVDIQKLREYWKEQEISPLSLPVKIHTIPAIPLLGSGKVDRMTLVKQIEMIEKE